jgi:DNA-binding XRE family transcriptional regulator
MGSKEQWASFTKEQKIAEADRAKNIHRSNRRQAVEILGGCCAVCGYSDERALQIDHINGGGKKEIDNTTSYARHKWIIDYPDKAKKKYQILCANCNWIKRYENKEVRRFDLKLRHKTTTGENIKRLREDKNMTQEDLAQILGVTSSNISQIESGDRGLNISKAQKIAQALGVTIDELVRE